ncbi:hypothetical protein EB75_28750, partial [Mycobacterium sp. ST-F2]|uniref:lipase family protein n=1 Tax=Mycobacterium sp. ST-F2 TaxID=1490484 RepID=UPI000938B76E
MTRLRASVLSLLACTVLLAGCGSTESEAAPQRIANADMSQTGPGSLVEAWTIPKLDTRIVATGAEAARVLYRSTSGIDGSPTEVSGAVFVPPGDPPPGGWPVVAYGHGTSGVQQQCAPSLSKDIFGTAPLIAAYIKLGYAVAVADYQGLGAPGGHPYLDSKTAGLNIIDSVRALRKLSPKVSTKWGGVGGSQGGSAMWAANEQAATYGTDLNLVGTVSMAPAADITQFAQLAADQKLSKDQQAAYIWLLMGIAQTRPGFPIDDYRNGVAAENWDTLAACVGPETEKRAAILSDLPASSLVPSSPEAVTRLTDILASMALPQQKAAAPMLVLYGGKDTYINSEWTRAAIQRACAMGTIIESDFQEGKGHGDVDSSAYLEWLGKRFQGQPPPDN